MLFCREIGWMTAQPHPRGGSCLLQSGRRMRHRSAWKTLRGFPPYGCVTARRTSTGPVGHTALCGEARPRGDAFCREVGWMTAQSHPRGGSDSCPHQPGHLHAAPVPRGKRCAVFHPTVASPRGRTSHRPGGPHRFMWEARPRGDAFYREVGWMTAQPHPRGGSCLLQSGRRMRHRSAWKTLCGFLPYGCSAARARLRRLHRSGSYR